MPDITAVGSEDYSYRKPCTPPQFFHADHDLPAQPGQWYVETQDLNVHNLPGGGPPRCLKPQPHDLVTDPEWQQRIPEGRR